MAELVVSSIRIFGKAMAAAGKQAARSELDLDCSAWILVRRYAGSVGAGSAAYGHGGDAGGAVPRRPAQ